MCWQVQHRGWPHGLLPWACQLSGVFSSALTKRSLRFLGRCHSGSDPPENPIRAGSDMLGDSFFTVSWVAAVGGKVLVGVGYSCVQEWHTVSGPFCCEFDGGVGLVDFFYEAAQTFLSMIPKGEHVINVSTPYCWLFSCSCRSSLPMKIFA